MELDEIFKQNGIKAENYNLGTRLVMPDGTEQWLVNKKPHNPAMLTDKYQFTMMAVYVEAGKADDMATFSAFYRKNPFSGGFAIAAGLEQVIDYIQILEFTKEDIEHMKSWNFPESFYEYLKDFKFRGNIDAVPEGTMVQPYEPIIQVTAPLPIANFVETYVLNQLGFASLVATKAARMYYQAENGKIEPDNAPTHPILEFGLRRVQGGLEGGLIASRAAYIGGCVGTSNVLAEQVHGIPAKGTCAHSMTMAFDDEYEAFKAYAEIFRDSSVFLIDTYGYEHGIKNAIKVSKQLGINPLGVRDDSGDLAYQSKVMRTMLDQAGYNNAKIVVSNDLDEKYIASLRNQGAAIDLFGIGTKLATADGSPSLGIVYKLAEINGRPVIKLSGDRVKVTDPGRKQVYRTKNGSGYFAGDVMVIDDEELSGKVETLHRMDDVETKTLDMASGQPLLVPIFRDDKLVYENPNIQDIRKNTLRTLSQCWPEMLRTEDPAGYWVGLSPGLAHVKKDLIDKYRIRR